MKKILPILFLVFFAVSPAAYAEDMTEKPGMSNATTYAVAYHADWCGSCKVLAPKMDEVKAALPKEVAEKIEFVKFDFTDDATKETSKTMAEGKGLLDLYLNDAKTGQVKLVDIESGNVLGTIKKDLSVEEINGAMTAISTRS